MLIVYALIHFLTDFACAQWMRRADAPELIAYNFCAFALQLPLGLLTDRLGRGGKWAAAGCALTAEAAFLRGRAPVWLVAGIGNALFHLGAGTEVLRSGKDHTRPGIFIAPGALGIALGAAAELPKALTAALLSVSAILLWVLHSFHKYDKGAEEIAGTGKISAIAAAGIFAVVILRSMAGSLNGTAGAFAGGLAMSAVFLGKAAGGILADRFGSARVSAVSLCTAALLWVFADRLPLAALTALFFFNMTMPVTLRAAARLLPGREGTAFGALTLALFIGFLPAAVGVPAFHGAELCALALASAGLLWCSLEKLK